MNYRGKIMTLKINKHLLEIIKNEDCSENIKYFLMHAFEFELYNVDKKPKKIRESYEKLIDKYIER